MVQDLFKPMPAACLYFMHTSHVLLHIYPKERNSLSFLSMITFTDVASAESKAHMLQILCIHLMGGTRQGELFHIQFPLCLFSLC